MKEKSEKGLKILVLWIGTFFGTIVVGGLMIDHGLGGLAFFPVILMWGLFNIACQRIKETKKGGKK